MARIRKDIVYKFHVLEDNETLRTFKEKIESVYSSDIAIPKGSIVSVIIEGPEKNDE